MSYPSVHGAAVIKKVQMFEQVNQMNLHYIEHSGSLCLMASLEDINSFYRFYLSKIVGNKNM